MLTSRRCVCFTTLRTTWEVMRYLPSVVHFLASRGVHVEERALEGEFHRLPVRAIPDSLYLPLVPVAERLIGRRDPDDVDILALTLRLRVPLWTNDRDLEGIEGIETVTTAQLLATLEQEPRSR